jgi:hypothetical protein
MKHGMHKDKKKKPTGNEYARGDYGYGGMAKKKMMGGGKVKRAMYKDGGMPKAKPC